MMFNTLNNRRYGKHHATIISCPNKSVTCFLYVFRVNHLVTLAMDIDTGGVELSDA